tara:strand:+ start:834 stop:1319 length:486 start_codon:yes stop_codon:yes gene_type:complete
MKNNWKEIAGGSRDKTNEEIFGPSSDPLVDKADSGLNMAVTIYDNGTSIKLEEATIGMKTQITYHRFRGINKYTSLNGRLEASGFTFCPRTNHLVALPHPHEVPYLERFDKEQLIHFLEAAVQEIYQSEVVDTDSVDSINEEFGDPAGWKQMKYESLAGEW